MRLNYSVLVFEIFISAPGKVGNGVLGDVCVPNGPLIAVLLSKTAVLDPARG